MRPADLFYRHRLGQIARLVDIGALENGDMVAEQLKGNGVENGRDNVADMGQLDNLHARLGGKFRRFIGKHKQLTPAGLHFLQIGF